MDCCAPGPDKHPPPPHKPETEKPNTIISKTPGPARGQNNSPPKGGGGGGTNKRTRGVEGMRAGRATGSKGGKQKGGGRTETRIGGPRWEEGTAQGADTADSALDNL